MKKVNFGEIKAGKFFYAYPSNTRYIKLRASITDREGISYNAVNIDAGELAFFTEGASVGMVDDECSNNFAFTQISLV